MEERECEGLNFFVMYGTVFGLFAGLQFFGVEPRVDRNNRFLGERVKRV